MNPDTQEQDLQQSEAMATLANDLGQRRIKMTRRIKTEPRKQARPKRIQRYRRGSLLRGTPELY